MYFMLGNIAFEPVNLTDFSESHTADFAEHNVLKGKPRLQAMGEKLTTFSFALRLHHKIGGVESRYKALMDAKGKQQALALLWGRGKYKGNFVITDISSTTLFTDSQGNALCREMNISLKEFVGDRNNSLLGKAINAGKGSLLGSILPPDFVAGFNKTKEVLQNGINLYNQGKQAIDEVKNTVAIVRQFAHDPASALAYLPSALGSLDNALGGFGELTGMSELFDGVHSVLPEMAEFSQGMSDITSELAGIQADFQRGQAGASWDNWFTPADNALSNINDRIDMLAPKVAKMTAWIVLRSDEEENATDLT